MLQSGRIPLWIVATVAGTGILVVVGLLSSLPLNFFPVVT